MAPTYEWTSAPATAEVALERRAFLKRTYGHLLGAVMGFVIVELIFFKMGWARGLTQTLAQSQSGWLLVLGGFMLVGWMASRTAASSLSQGAQYAALALYVVAEAIIFVPMLYIASEYAPGAIQSAGLITLLGFAGLTAIAFLMGEDFTFLGGLLRWVGICALLTIVCAVLFKFELGAWFSVVMIAFAGAAVLRDTSAIMLHYPSDRHVAAALALFASVALMFWYVLRLIMASRR